MGTLHQRGRANPLDKRKEAHRARQAAVALLVLGVTFPLAGLPANAAVTEITPPHTIEVLPGLDIAAAEGFEEDIVMEVWRDGLKIASTGAPQTPPWVIPDADLIAQPMTRMLEVNHDGGTCWAGSTPDIIAGDEIRVITEDGADPVGEKTTVADISVNEPKIADLDADGAFNDVVMTGVARNADGSPMDISNPATVSAEIVQPALRDIGIPNFAPRALRADATGVQLDADTPFSEDGFGTLTADPVKGAPYWVATWKNLPEVPENIDRPSVPQLLLDGEHNFAVAAGPGDEDTGGLGTTIAQPGDASGPAQGCPASGDADAVKGTSPSNVNIAAADLDNLTISGTSFNANAVHVSLDDSDGDSSDAILVEAIVNDQALLDETTSPVEPVKQTWKATVPMDQITSGLDDGELVASGVFDRVIETEGQREVPATNADGTPVLEPALNEDGSPVAAGDASLYTDANGPVQATGETGAPMFAADGTTPVYTRQVLRTETFYTHTVSPRTGGTHTLLKDLEAPAAPTANLDAATSYIGTQWLTLHAGNEVEETVRYRMGDATITDPGLGSPAVTSQLALSSSQTVKARSVDRAGNLGPVFTGTYTVTAPVAPSAPLALGVTEANGEVTVNWTAPDNNGGAAITGFRVRADNGRTTPLVAEVADVLTSTLTGLTPGDTYTVTVAAVNEAGRGAWSEGSSVTISVPAPPTPPEPTDLVAPLLMSQLPAAGSTSVSTRNNLLVSFNEAVTGVSAANLQLRNTATNSVVPANVTYDPVTMTAQLNPGRRLAPGVRHTAVLRGLTDQAGNPMDTQRWSFTTDPAPRIAFRSPAPGARGVGRVRNVRIQLTERITGISIRSVQLRQTNNGRRVPAVLRYRPASETITINPRRRLGSRTSYTVTLTRALKDTDRYAVPRTTWRFRTR